MGGCERDHRPTNHGSGDRHSHSDGSRPWVTRNHLVARVPLPPRSVFTKILDSVVCRGERRQRYLTNGLRRKDISAKDLGVAVSGQWSVVSGQLSALKLSAISYQLSAISEC